MGLIRKCSFVSQGGPHLPPNSGSARWWVPCTGTGALPAEPFKVAKEPCWYFLEYIYSQLHLDIKIGRSWRQMTESFKDSDYRSLLGSVLRVACYLYTKWKEREMTVYAGCCWQDGPRSRGTDSVSQSGVLTSPL